MYLIKHELKQGWKTFAIWTAAISFFIAVCVMIFPEMKEEMGEASDIFSSMGAFTAAFGMDRLNFGTFSGFYAIECGNILGIGGSFFASLIAVNMLAKEEKERTAEFLLSHPVSRARIITEKLAAVLIQVITLNVIVFLITAVTASLMGEEILWKEIGMLHLAHLLIQLELAGICFGISAFLTRSGMGIGLGIAAVMYFLNIVANITEDAAFLKYITPFGYANGADIIEQGSLDLQMVGVGMGLMILGILASYWKYMRKDIQ